MKQQQARNIFTATCLGLYFLIIFLSSRITCTTGFVIFFPLSSINLTVPTSDKALKLLSKIPLGKFNVVSLNKSDNISSYLYKLEYGEDLLQINGRTGEVFTGKNFQNLDKPTKFIISARNYGKNMTNSAHMSFQITPNNTEDYCQNIEMLCFWDSAVYTVAEDNNLPVNRSNRIAELGPRSYRYLCPQYDITYRLLNGTKYLRLNDSTLYTKFHVDHDSPNPGSSTTAIAQCSVKKTPNSVPQDIIKVIHVVIADINDNGPVLQDDMGFIFKIDDPNFYKGKLVGPKSIIFLDKDSLTVNDNITYIIHNDTYDILQPICKIYEADHMGLKNSVINCKIIFSRDSVLRKSPYCVTLEATDKHVDSDKNSASATICITADLNKIHELDRPTALALHAAPVYSERTRGRKNSRKLVVGSEESLASQESSQKNLKPIPIQYPQDVYVYRTASNLTRVTQPERMTELINRTLTKFKILDDPTRAFSVTQAAGIIYVNNVTALQTAPETIYYLTVSWQKGTVNIIIHLEDGRPPNTTCESREIGHPLQACSEAGSKKECNQLCGIGTNGGSCHWRGTNVSGLTVNYLSCTPHLDTCPDNICDPLEEIAQKVDIFVCPQDCSQGSHIFGPHTTNENGRGIYAASGVCTCDHFGKCSCAVLDTFPAKTKKSNRKKEQLNEMNRKQNQTAGQIIPHEIMRATSTGVGTSSFECGPSCLMLVIGCPTVLVIIVIALLISRRKYVRRVKRKVSEEKTVNDGDTNRTSELPLVSITNNFKFETNIDPKWEFPRAHLLLDITLGEGEFGKVVKGFATNIAERPGLTTVAVKMLKTGANSVEHFALLSEFQLLQEVSHPNVIKLLGACTQGENPLLIIEYAVYGSLRNYLRLSRKIECSGIEFTNGVEAVTVKDILSFAWQICKGMIYLTEIKLVHRDLAARNVLLAEGKICKVSDFGLTRDVYEDDAYLKRSKDRVPVKWMAPESLADHVYTTKSDVWAFGVLAWELITLGASPYPGVPPQNLYHLLKTGYRMERPENCSEEIYSIIRTCWADDSTARPSFKYLSSQWEKLLGNNIKYLEFEANAVSNPEYCQDTKLSQTNLPKTLQDDFGEPDKLDHLWRSPVLDNHTIDHSNSFLDQCNEIDQFIVPPGYDMPRPLIEANTTEQTLRYANDLRFPLNIKTTRISQQFDPAHYSVPVKRGKSYIDMTNKNLIIDNLDNEDIEKKLSKNITFRFSSLLNLNEQTANSVV